MSEILDFRGTPCTEPYPKIAGLCEACSEDMYDYEATECECGRQVHEECRVTCYSCEYEGCKGCMIYHVDLDEWACNECIEEAKA